ncbi:hypothetical protein SAMN05660330_04440 [Desulforhopalus singaporensis]|uniref:Uncharacterized protein n=2 Tax=Desulforhopalus singaporensis TaxID=91360 RepID=A0A1H0W6J6_9BACT|nr:hypothetical protein SAMN05660330_04440 [Desulforhopalus singaporensis]
MIYSKHLACVCCAVLVFSSVCFADINNFKGKWVQTEKERDGFGHVFFFYDNGNFSMQYGAISETQYHLQGDILIESGMPPQQNMVLARYVYSVTKSSLTLQRIISYTPIKLSKKQHFTRINVGKNTESKIVGQWVTHTPDKVPITLEYTSNGKKIFFIPEKATTGVFKVKDSIIQLSCCGGKSGNCGKYQLKNNLLIRVDSLKDKNKETYSKW